MPFSGRFDLSATWIHRSRGAGQTVAKRLPPCRNAFAPTMREKPHDIEQSETFRMTSGNSRRVPRMRSLATTVTN